MKKLLLLAGAIVLSSAAQADSEKALGACFELYAVALDDGVSSADAVALGVIHYCRVEWAKAAVDHLAGTDPAALEALEAGFKEKMMQWATATVLKARVRQKMGTSGRAEK